MHLGIDIQFVNNESATFVVVECVERLRMRYELNDYYGLVYLFSHRVSRTHARCLCGMTSNAFKIA